MSLVKAYVTYWLTCLRVLRLTAGPADHYGWSWPHRKHAACWRGSEAGREWQRVLTEAVNRSRREEDQH